MAARRNTLREFIQEHPVCCLCGGTVLATSREHAPPIVMFANKDRPKGLEVPACDRCNHGSSQSDQVAALLAHMSSPVSIGQRPDLLGIEVYLDKLMSGVANNALEQGALVKSSNEAWLKVNGLHRPMRLMQVSPHIVDTFLYPWAAKQTAATWYAKTGQIFSTSDIMNINWLGQQALYQSPQLIETLSRLPTVDLLPKGKRQDFRDQFMVKSAISDDAQIGVFWFIYQSCLSFVSYVSKRYPNTGQGVPVNKWIGRRFTTNQLKGLHQWHDQTASDGSDEV